MLAVLFPALLAAGSARAQGNDRSAPTGGRSALMGNTGVALGRDGSAPFMNPATIVGIADNHLAFSVNFFTYSVRQFSRWNQPGTVNTTAFGNLALDAANQSSTRFRALPSTLCLFFTLASILPFIDDAAPDSGTWRGRRKLAFCLGTLESDDVSLTALSFTGATAAGHTTQIESISRSWNRLYVGPTFGIAPVEPLALGVSLHGVVTGDSFTVEGSNITSLVGGKALQAGLGTAGNGYSFDVLANVGATYRLGRLTLGIDGQLPSLHALGHFEATAHDEYSGTQETADVASATGTFSAPPPVRLAVGAGYRWPRLVLEIDGSVDFPWSDALASTLSVSSTHLSGTSSVVSTSTATYSVATHAMVNAAVGGEYFVTRGFSLIGGASTNISSLPQLAASTSVGNLVQERKNHVALSLGIGSYGSAADILIGTQLDYGWGESLVVNPYVLPNTWAVMGTQIYSATLILAGTTDLRAIANAVEKVGRAVVTGNPDKPTPPPSALPTDSSNAPPAPPSEPSSPPTEPPPKPPNEVRPKPPNEPSSPPTESPPTERPATNPPL